MKRALGLMMIFAAGCVSQTTTKEEDDVPLRDRPARPLANRPIVAVLDFVDKTDYGRGRLGTGASDVLSTGFLEGQQVRLVERQQISKCMDELKLEHSGITDSATAA